jgi:hypothetical protein
MELMLKESRVQILDREGSFHDAVSQKLPASEIWEISAFYHVLIVLELGQRIGPTSRRGENWRRRPQ